MLAKSLIRDVEEMELSSQTGAPSYRTEATQFSIQHSVLCSYTAFVAVEQLRQGHKELPAGIIAAHKPESLAQTRNFLSGHDCDIAQLEALTAQLRCMSESIDQCLDRSASLECLATDCDTTLHSAARFLRHSRSFRRTPILRFATGLASSCQNIIVSAAATILRHVSALLSQGAGFFVRSANDKNEPTVSVLQKLEQGSVANQAKQIGISDDTGACISQQHSAVFGTKEEPGSELSSSQHLEKLLRLARFDGSFAYSDGLCALTNIGEKMVALWAQEQWAGSIHSDVLVTVLVLACLRTHFFREKETWQLLAKKSTDWLQSQEQEWCCEGIKSIDALLAAASSRQEAYCTGQIIV
jgi:hypothetical protein